MVVAKAAPSKWYLGIKMVFKIIHIGSKSNTASIAILGFPLAVIIFAKIENTVKKPNPKNKMLNEVLAGKYFKE